GRFAVAAMAAFATTEIVFTVCAGPLILSATWATMIAWFSGALVSYILSRWAWKRKGRPSLLKETLPFWIVSAMVVAILTLANKFGYHSAGWMRLHGVERVLYLDAVSGVAEEALASTDLGPEPFARTPEPEVEIEAEDPGDR